MHQLIAYKLTRRTQLCRIAKIGCLSKLLTSFNWRFPRRMTLLFWARLVALAWLIPLFLVFLRYVIVDIKRSIKGARAWSVVILWNIGHVHCYRLHIVLRRYHVFTFVIATFLLFLFLLELILLSGSLLFFLNCAASNGFLQFWISLDVGWATWTCFRAARTVYVLSLARFGCTHIAPILAAVGGEVKF